MKTREEQVEEMAKAIYATGVALNGTDYAFGVYDKDDHFHRMANVLYAAGYRKQSDTVREFVEKLRDKEFSAKIGSEWCAVVKSRDIDEFVKEGSVRRMKKIDGEYIVKLQAATIRKFAAEDCDFPNGRAVKANERAIQKWLDKITDNADEQRQILDVVERGNWNREDKTFKPIFDELRALGYEIVIEGAQK